MTQAEKGGAAGYAVEIAGFDSLIVRLSDTISVTNIGPVNELAALVRADFGALLVDVVPSYTTVLIQFDWREIELDQAVLRMRALLNADASDAETSVSQRDQQRHVLKVWYDESVGPDLTRLCSRTGLDSDALVKLHCSQDYSVFALGFVPGFAFLGLVDERLATPRIETPRQKVPAGSVGIAERQTAVYPINSPGGWNLIGRCPQTLFDQALDGFSLLKPGDTVRFQSIAKAEFLELGGDLTPVVSQ